MKKSFNFLYPIYMSNSQSNNIYQIFNSKNQESSIFVIDSPNKNIYI